MESLKAIKAGNDLLMTYSLPIEFGSALSGISCDVCKPDFTLIEHLTILQLSDTLTESVWQISATNEQTLLWSLGKNICDIKHLGVDGTEISSDTFLIPVIQQVTE